MPCHAYGCGLSKWNLKHIRSHRLPSLESVWEAEQNGLRKNQIASKQEQGNAASVNRALSKTPDVLPDLLQLYMQNGLTRAEAFTTRDIQSVERYQP